MRNKAWVTKGFVVHFVKTEWFLPEENEEELRRVTYKQTCRDAATSEIVNFGSREDQDWL